MKLGTLVTVASPREAARNSEAAKEAGLPLIVDSGAWSNFTGTANVTVADHIAYLRDHWITGERHVALDVIGDPDASYRNWMAEREAGLAVEPTIHYGEPVETVDRYVRAGLATEWINLGGMAHLQVKTSIHRKLAAWSAAVMKRCSEGTKFHGLGATTTGLNQLIRFDGIDSTYWLITLRWSTFPVFDSSVPALVPVHRSFRRKEWASKLRQRLGDQGDLLRRTVGVSATDVLMMPEDELLRLTFIAHLELGHFFSARHGHQMTVYLAGTNRPHFDDMSDLNRNGWKP